MNLTIGKKRFFVSSFIEASRIYSDLRDRSGLGGSKWPEGKIFENDRQIARISYNGRIWSPEPWTPDSVPLYDNR